MPLETLLSPMVSLYPFKAESRVLQPVVLSRKLLRLQPDERLAEEGISQSSEEGRLLNLMISNAKKGERRTHEQFLVAF